MEFTSSKPYNDLNDLLSDQEDEPPLPAPMTTRNRIPRSRATSLARSRGSSRASSVSGSRSGSIVASMAGSGAGSRPGSRTGHRDAAGSSYASGGGTIGGLHWQAGAEVDSLDDELGYVGVGSSSAGPSRSGQFGTEQEPTPMSNKAKGKKRARSTPDTEDEATARSKARVGPCPEDTLSQGSAPQFHDQAFTFHPATFSFSTQSQADPPPSTQSTLPSNSSGSVTLGSSMTLGSSDSFGPAADQSVAGSTTYPPLSSFDDYVFDFDFTPASPGLDSAPEDGTRVLAASSVGSSDAQDAEASSSKGKAPQTNHGSTADLSESASASRKETENGVAGSSSLPTSSAPAGSSSSSSSSAPASSSSTVVPLTPRAPQPPTPPTQPDPLSSYTCPICFFPPSNATLTPCGHICCGSCLFTAIKSSQSRNGMGFSHSTFASNGEALCPVCRAAIPGWDGKGGGVIGLRVRSVISI